MEYIGKGIATCGICGMVAYIGHAVPDHIIGVAIAATICILSVWATD
jgi:hypothetical protein